MLRSGLAYPAFVLGHDQFWSSRAWVRGCVGMLEPLEALGRELSHSAG